MIIYKVQYFVKNNIGGKRPRHEDFEDKMEIIIDNFETVLECYKMYKRDWECSVAYTNRFGKVQAFIPHIFASGTLANWPINQEYIGQAWKEQGGEIVEQKLMDEKFFVENL